MLQRDVKNLADTLGRFAPELLTTDYAREMWASFEQGNLTPDTPLTGVFVDDGVVGDLGNVILAIDDARDEAVRRQRGREAASREVI
jgi:RIO kinase 1